MTPASDLVVGGDGLVTRLGMERSIRAKSVSIAVVMPLRAAHIADRPPSLLVGRGGDEGGPARYCQAPSVRSGHFVLSP
jgi:hypothetical protein